MKRLFIFLLFPFSLLARDYTLYAPRIPEAHIEEAEPIQVVPVIFAQTNTFCASNLTCTVSAAWTFSSSLTVSGTLLCRNFENVQCVDSTLARGGSDIGAEINLAYTALPSGGGEIYVAAPAASGSCYNYSTPISFSTVGKPVILQGLATPTNSITNPGGVCLNYTPTTATNAMVMDWIPASGNGGGHSPGSGLRDIVLQNNNCATNGGCGSLATGINIGPVNGGVQFGLFENVKIAGFGTGITVGGAGFSWGNQFLNSSFVYNTTGFATSTAEETINFVGGVFLSNATGVSLVTTSAKFHGTHFDSNTVLAINTSGTGTVTISGAHFENFGVNTTHYYNGPLNLVIIGGDALDDCTGAIVGACTTGSPIDYWFNTLAGVTVSGLGIGSGGRTVTNLVVVSGAADLSFINSASATLTPCPNATSVACKNIISTTNTVTTSLPSLTIGGTGNPSNSLFTVNYNSGTKQAAVWSNSAASGRCWSLGDGVGAAAGVFGFYDCTAPALRAQLSTSAFFPGSAAGLDLGATALPFGNLWLGTAATNNFKFAPATTAAARTITINDPLGNVNLPLTIASGTKALNTASITTATCDAGVAATATGTLSTDAVDWSFNAAPTATNKYGAFLVVYAVPSANTVTFYTCNPSATTSTPTAMTVNWSVRRP